MWVNIDGCIHDLIYLILVFTYKTSFFYTDCAICSQTYLFVEPQVSSYIQKIILRSLASICLKDFLIFNTFNIALPQKYYRCTFRYMYYTLQDFWIFDLKLIVDKALDLLDV